jgi:glycosyltransferase involved in cell wall biosynthesis
MSNLPQDFRLQIAIRYSDNVYLRHLQGYEDIAPVFDVFEKFAHGLSFRGKKRLFQYMKNHYPEKYPTYKESNLQTSIDCLKKQNFDIFHPTYYDDYFLQYIGNKPFVLTVHDMTHEMYPELFVRNYRTSPAKKRDLAHKANHIIAVSENTKKDIMDFWGIKEDKISVVYHANSLKKDKTVAGLPAKYILYTGDRSGYKNFLFFATVIAPILHDKKDLYVVCTGDKFNAHEIKLFDSLQIKDHFVHLFAEEDTMFDIYNQAIAFIYPSYYEGFGIPILEAFHAACPVLISQASCFPEIAKDAALYFEPKNVSQLRIQIEKIIDDSTLRDTLIAKGLDRNKDFSWQKSVEQTAAIYRKVISGQ